MRLRVQLFTGDKGEGRVAAPAKSPTAITITISTLATIQRLMLYPSADRSIA
jgi:hypothetical protein